MKPNGISIIVPQYSENEDVLKFLLNSIAAQIAIKRPQFEVIIVNDCGGHKLSKKFLDSYRKHFNLYYFSTPVNGGPGLAREFGTTKSKFSHLLFVDADDYIAYPMLLEHFMRTDAEIIDTTVIQESDDGYHPLRPNSTFVHGKLISKEFLEHHNIHWHPKLRLNEDGYFFGLISALQNKRATLDGFYSMIIKNNQNSLTRTNKQNYKIQITYVEGMRRLCEELVRRNNPSIFVKVAQALYITFVNLHGRKDDLIGYAQLQAEFATFYVQWKKYYDMAPEEMKDAIVENFTDFGFDRYDFKELEETAKNIARELKNVKKV